MKYLFRKLLRKAAGRSAKALSHTQRAIDARIAEGLGKWMADKGFCSPECGMESLAEKLGVSREDLSYYCRTVIKTKFLSWRKQLRITEACRIMREKPELSMGDVGLLVGITDRTNFRRQFFEICGLAPSEWLRKVQGKDNGRIICK